MICPRCFADFEPGQAKCPQCGVQFVHNVSGVIKTSAVMIAAAGQRGFYRSVQDVPEPLRKRLLEITSSSNAGTIVIADRAGKEQITHVIGRRESAARARAQLAAPEPVLSKKPWSARVLGRSYCGLPGIAWAGLFLLLVAAAVIAIVFGIHQT